jgi:glyoxylase-like metal-dependent hydrolase (beta-lactamase superfamily II)
MREVAPGVWQLAGKPTNSINTYLVGDVLIDAGTVLDKKRILAELEGHEVNAHALTHAHIDHFGSSKAVCEKLGIPMWVGAKDVECVEKGKMVAAIPGLGEKLIPAGAPAHKVDRALEEGDEVAGFEVLFTPGHSPGHMSYWRDSDKTLICGDVMWGYNPFLMRGAPQQPFPIVSPDPATNRQSARRLALLQPNKVMFGHGPPLDGDVFVRAVAKLPL